MEKTSFNPPKKLMSFLDEITKGVTLKKVEIKPKIEEKKQPAKNDMNSTFLSAIKMRGMQLNQNKVDEDSEHSEDDWD